MAARDDSRKATVIRFGAEVYNKPSMANRAQRGGVEGFGLDLIEMRVEAALIAWPLTPRDFDLERFSLPDRFQNDL